MTRSLHSWLLWWANTCPWERMPRSPDLEVIGSFPQRRPPALRDRDADWITVSIIFTRLSPAHRHHILRLITGRTRRLPRNTERDLRRALKYRRMLA